MSEPKEYDRCYLCCCPIVMGVTGLICPGCCPRECIQQINNPAVQWLAMEIRAQRNWMEP